jgi:hypothetical protein
MTVVDSVAAVRLDEESGRLAGDYIKFKHPGRRAPGTPQTSRKLWPSGIFCDEFSQKTGRGDAMRRRPAPHCQSRYDDGAAAP